MNKPFVQHSQLYSGNPADAIPYLAVRQCGKEVVFQIPGGSGLVVDIKIALEFAVAIIETVGQTTLYMGDE